MGARSVDKSSGNKLVQDARRSGRVVDIDFSKGFGWIQDAVSGTRIWFHASAVWSMDFDDIIQGELVSYVPLVHEKGPRAGAVMRED